MAGREYRHALVDMREAIDGILPAAAGKTLDDYRADWLLRHAVQRGIGLFPRPAAHCPTT